MKQANFWPSRCTSLLLHGQTSTAKLETFLQKFKKIVYALEVNETKVTAIKALIDNLFELKSEKRIKK